MKNLNLKELRPKWVEVQSGMISDVYYDEDAETLYVMFKGGTVWAYFNVTVEENENMMEAPSIGKYFGSVIKADKDGIEIDE